MRKQFVQALSACFLLIFFEKEKRGNNFCTNCSESVCASCAFMTAHSNGGVQQRTLLRRVLRRLLETAFEKALRRVLRRCLAVGF